MASTLKASKQGLETVDLARRKKGWNKDAQPWIDTAKVSRSTLQRFWEPQAIQRLNFIAICKAVGINDWEAIVDPSPTQLSNSQISCFAYNEGWVGREKLVAELMTKMRRDTRVLILNGITGIGKTALGEKLAVELQKDWTEIRRVNFDNKPDSRDFVSVAAELLISWEETITPDDRKNAQDLLYRLVRRLRENRYLLLIDSLEEILKGNEEEGWSDFEDEWWLNLLQSLLSEEVCQSRLILTSQDLPGQLVEAGSRYQNFWHCQPLSGLEEKERLDLFAKTGLNIRAESDGVSYLQRIGAAYEGHPLALQVIAGEIKNTFECNVVAYWNKYGNEIEEVEKAIEEAKAGATSGHDKLKIDRFIQQMRRNVRSRIDQTLMRLQRDVPNAYILLCEASVYRCAVPEDFWLGHLESGDCNEEKQKIAMDALRDRYLVEKVIEKNQLLWRQHNLIRSAALEHLNQMGEDNE